MRKGVTYAALGVIGVAAAGAAGLALFGGAGATAPVARCEGSRAALAAGQRWIPAGAVVMGSDRFEPEEAPVREVALRGFWIDAHEVTNAQFRRFVEATGYVTVAERPPVWPEGADVPAEMRRPGAIVFRSPADLDGLGDITRWWQWTPGASWKHPEGPGSDLAGRDDHPVVQVAYEDARAYARWAGRDLPSEAQWERAARGKAQGRDYVWGNEPYPQGRQLANSWQGVFPVRDTADDGFAGIAPVGCFPANDFGLHDMAGNVWEWTRDGFESRRQAIATADGEPVTIKGGSWLCAPNFCGRFRPAARQPGDPLTGTTHIGFRTVKEAPGPGA